MRLLMGLLQDREMTPREFEQVCEELVKDGFPDDKYKITPKRHIRNGIMDILISERKRGGKRYVIECKHYPKTRLQKEKVVRQVEGDRRNEGYRRNERASKAILLISGATKSFSPGFEEYLNSKGIEVLSVSTSKLSLVNDIRNFFGVEKELKRIIP